MMRISNGFIRSPAFWIALSMGTLTHAAYFALDCEHYGEDTPSYLVPANNLLRGLGFVNAWHQPELWRTPGYPLILAIFQITPLRLEYLIVVQHALCVFLIAAVAAIGLRIAGSHLVSLVAASALSLDLATLRIANLLLTEIAATVLIILAAWMIYHAMARPAGAMFASAGAGILGGCAALIRPLGIFYFVPLSICLVLGLKRRALRPLMLFVASFSLLPLLWATRNFVEGHYFGISTIGNFNMLYYRAAGAVAVQQPGDYVTNVLRVRGAMLSQTCSELERAYHLNCLRVTEAQKASYYGRRGLSIILHSPLSYLQSALRSLAYIVFGGGAEALSRISKASPHSARHIVLLFTVPAAFLALIGCAYWYRQDRHLFYVLVLSIAYFLAISAGAESYSRFRVPIMPMYALLIGGGAERVVQIFQRTRASRALNSNAIVVTERHV
jgi:hypothetical protein